VFIGCFGGILVVRSLDARTGFPIGNASAMVVADLGLVETAERTRERTVLEPAGSGF
jgi:hypothetical protein